MTRKRDRAFALFGAILFFLTSIALTVSIVIQMTRDSKTNNAANSTQSNTAKKEGDMLAGTKLEGYEPVQSVTELRTEDAVEGTGAEVKAGATVSVDYTGALAKTGVIFESSKDTGSPVSLGLNQVIDGWKEGIPGMKVGGTRRLYIPAAMAYGAREAGSIPANSDLVFDVTVHSAE